MTAELFETNAVQLELAHDERPALPRRPRFHVSAADEAQEELGSLAVEVRPVDDSITTSCDLKRVDELTRLEEGIEPS